MLSVYSGTDRKKVRDEMDKAIASASKHATRIIRVSDAQGVEDLRAALGGSGLFSEKRVVVLDGILQNEEMRELFLSVLEGLESSEDTVFLYEEKLDAKTKRLIEKHAGSEIKQYDAAKQKDSGAIFALARALESADKKALWIGLEKELASGSAPEAIHGVLFWGAKQLLLKAKKGTPDASRGEKLVAQLAELPHLSRRGNVPLEYALLRFALSLA